MQRVLFATGFAILFGAGADAQQALTNLGTLTCTTSEPSAESGRDANLSCQFRSLSGRDSTYAGHITRRGQADIPPGKRVIVWTVLARDTEADRDISGSFRGTTGGTPTTALIAENKTVRLEPVTVTSQIGDQPTETVLQLMLTPTKA